MCPGVCEPTTGAPAHEISIISGRFSGLPSCSGPSWMIQDSPPTRHRPNMWNCRNVKKSCMCAEKKIKKNKKSCCRVSKSPRKTRNCEDERGRRGENISVTFTEMFQLDCFPPDTKLLTISIPRFRSNMSVKRDGFGSRTEPSGSSAVLVGFQHTEESARWKEKVFSHFRELL